MTAYLIRHHTGQLGDILIEDPHLTLTFTHTWAVFSDQHGPSFAIPAEQVANIQRVDDQGQQDDTATGR